MLVFLSGVEEGFSSVFLSRLSFLLQVDQMVKGRKYANRE